MASDHAYSFASDYEPARAEVTPVNESEPAMELATDAPVLASGSVMPTRRSLGENWTRPLSTRVCWKPTKRSGENVHTFRPRTTSQNYRTGPDSACFEIYQCYQALRSPWSGPPSAGHCGFAAVIGISAVLMVCKAASRRSACSSSRCPGDISFLGRPDSSASSDRVIVEALPTRSGVELP